ncbi:MAG TPA: hypothetical protein PKK96_12625 [Anaerolineales bacterium]|nr:hypothetical protein [Anaerolineales bacterium]HNQ95463.1 hypothetical protein [Anaerolineales bacterium]HNS61846.1 hypothetical protein [Anaerolineales bacterium]
MWSAVQITLFVLGILCALGADKLSMPVLVPIGLIFFGLGGMAVGWEAIFTRQIKLGSRRSGSLQTYSGFPAVLQGIQFNLIGLFLIGAAGLVSLKDGRGIVEYFAIRPGIPLSIFGLLTLLQSLIMFLGYRQINTGQGWMVMLNLVFSRMLPGAILLALGLGLLALGLVEIVAPATFDQLGGEILETMYR